MKKPLFFIFIPLLLFAMQHDDLNGGKSDFTPPGTVLIAPNFYIDETEITNFNWLEYLYWTSSVYGDSSAQYMAILPKEELWLKEDSCIQDLSNIYLRHFAYRDFPLVGITQQQAEDFCKWRSDRVFEYYLESKNIVEWNLNPDSTNFFTIERYFAGELGIQPDPRYLKYPVYKLPSEDEWYLAHNYFETRSKENLAKMKLFQNKKMTEKYLIYFDIMPCSGDIFIEEPTHDVFGINMLGNVSEWLAEKNMVIGGDWKTKRNNPLSGKRKEIGPSVSIGFRCACEFKEYKK